jgi:hypothetical protein
LLWSTGSYGKQAAVHFYGILHLACTTLNVFSFVSRVRQNNFVRASDALLFMFIGNPDAS